MMSAVHILSVPEFGSQSPLGSPLRPLFNVGSSYSKYQRLASVYVLRFSLKAVESFQPCPTLAALFRRLLALAFQSLCIMTGDAASSGLLLLTS